MNEYKCFQLYKKEWHLNFLWHFSSELGGNLDHDHPAWLEHCVEVSTKRNGEVVTMSSSQPSTPVRSHPTLEQLESLPVIICSNGMGSSGEGKNYWSFNGYINAKIKMNIFYRLLL